MYRFAQVIGLNVFCAIQISDGARDFQDAVVRAGGEAQPRDGVFKQLFAFGQVLIAFLSEVIRW